MAAQDREYIDIYNAAGEKTGEVRPRKGGRLAAGEYMLYALSLIENSVGQFLITRRALDKSWGAGWWEIPGGGARSGEDSRAAANRETIEETGLDVSTLTPVSVYSYRNDDPDGGDNYFCAIYHFRMDFAEDDVQIQAEELSGFTLMRREELRAAAADGHFLHYSRIMKALAAEG